MMEMTAAEQAESLNELIIAIGEYLGDKYTVYHMPEEDMRNRVINIAVIDNNLDVAAQMKIARTLVTESEDDPDVRDKMIEVMSREALKSIRIEAEKPA